MKHPIKYFSPLAFAAFISAAPVRQQLANDANYLFIKGDGYSGCIEPLNSNVQAGNALVLGDCSNELNTWRMEDIDNGFVRFRSRRDPNMCLQATHAGNLVGGSWSRVYPCQDDNSLQSFAWNGNKIVPRDKPSLCTVYQGSSPRTNESVIIFKDCKVIQGQEQHDIKKGWKTEAAKKDDETEETDKHTIFPDPNDRRLVKTVSSDGTEITYFGTKDASGSALSFDEFLFNSGDETIVARMDTIGRPSVVLTEDGSRMQFNWVSETVVVVDYVTGDGSRQGIVEVDLETLETEAGGGDQRRRLKPHSPGEPQARRKVSGRLRHLQPAASSGAVGEASIELSRCGDVPVEDAIIRVDVTLESTASGEKRLESHLAHHQGGGIYLAEFPLDSVALGDQPLQETCGVVSQVVDAGCNGLTTIPLEQVTDFCSEVSSPFQETADAVQDRCVAVLTAAHDVCSIVGFLCDGTSAFSAPVPIGTDQVTIQPLVISHLPNDFFGPETVGLTGPFPTFSYDLVGSDEPTVESFIIDPIDPAPGQDYVAIATASCVGDSVGISIVGTDDYYDEIVCDVIGGTTVECELTVPGADEGISDEVTLSIDGDPVRSVSIVF